MSLITLYNIIYYIFKYKFQYWKKDILIIFINNKFISFFNFKLIYEKIIIIVANYFSLNDFKI